MSTVRVLNQEVKTLRKVETPVVSEKFLEKKQSLQKKAKLTTIAINATMVCVAMFFAFQFARGTVINIDRYMTLNTKMDSLKALNSSAVYQNAVLKKKYQSYNSPEGLEGLARDYLNLVGENEISIVLKKS